MLDVDGRREGRVRWTRGEDVCAVEGGGWHGVGGGGEGPQRAADGLDERGLKDRGDFCLGRK